MNTDFKNCSTSSAMTEEPNNPCPDNICTYLDNDFPKIIKASSEREAILTGFPIFDCATGGLYPGLYIIGAPSSLGKSTFMLQMAMQIAKGNTHVVFFSHEQSKAELTSKILNHVLCSMSNKSSSALDIRHGKCPEADFQAACMTYKQTFGNRLSIVEGNFDLTIAAIEKYTLQYAKENQTSPVVIIDYLQIVPSGQQYDNTKKDQVDKVLAQAKQLSNRIQMPVFMISSINRSNYLSPISYESFKETGEIEYTADFLCGLQLHVLDTFGKSKPAEKQQLIANAKAAIPRELKLVCLKNRMGPVIAPILFHFYPQYDTFVEALEISTQHKEEDAQLDTL